MPGGGALASPQEVADFLQVPVNTLMMWRYRGTGPQFLKVGRAVRYAWPAVEQWLREQQIRA